MLRLPFTAPQAPTDWEWVHGSEADVGPECTFVIDGSKRLGHSASLTRTGCAMVVLDENEGMKAAAYAVPPPWVKNRFRC